MKKAYIFDLDGTLIDSLSSIANNYNNAATALDLPKIDVDEFKYLAGDGSFELCKRAVNSYNFNLSEVEREILIKKVYEKYIELYHVASVDIPPFEGMVEVLRTIKNRGNYLAVTTNKPHVVANNICKEVFSNIFDVVIGLSDSIKRKPNPEMVELAIKNLGVEKKNVYYFGDTDTDMQTAKNAGVYAVGVLWGFRDISELSPIADSVISEVEQITEFI